MKTVEHFLCFDCEKDLTQAGLVHKKLPNTEETGKCEFCKRRRYGARYLIQYGRERA